MYHELFLQGRPDLVEGILKGTKANRVLTSQQEVPSTLGASFVRQKIMSMRNDATLNVGPSVPSPASMRTVGGSLGNKTTPHEQRYTEDVCKDDPSHYLSNGLINLLSENMINLGDCWDRSTEDELPEIEDTSNLLVNSSGFLYLANLALPDLDELIDMPTITTTASVNQDHSYQDQQQQSYHQDVYDLLEPTPFGGSYSSSQSASHHHGVVAYNLNNNNQGQVSSESMRERHGQDTMLNSFSMFASPDHQVSSCQR